MKGCVCSVLQQLQSTAVFIPQCWHFWHMHNSQRLLLVFSLKGRGLLKHPLKLVQIIPARHLERYNLGHMWLKRFFLVEKSENRTKGHETYLQLDTVQTWARKLKCATRYPNCSGYETQCLKVRRRYILPWKTGTGNNNKILSIYIIPLIYKEFNIY